MYQIIRGGCTTKHENSFIMSRPNGLPHYVLLLVKSPAEFMINNCIQKIEGGHGIILTPGTPYKYHNPSGEYIDDWLHFDLENSKFHSSFTIGNQLFPLSNIDLCSNLIAQILWEKNYGDNEHKDHNIDFLFMVLLNHYFCDHKNKDNIKDQSPYFEKLRSIQLELRNSSPKNHSISYYASELGISESYFQHLYTSFFHISFQKDLILSRIEHGKDLLLSSDLTVNQIGIMCGYHNEVHFYRQFKTLTGMTPTQYRSSCCYLSASDHI